MSDSEEDEPDPQRRRVRDRPLSYRSHPVVFRAMQDCCDSIQVEVEIGGEKELSLDRFDELKPVVLIATRFNVYLFKQRDMRLYYRWNLADVSVIATNTYRKVVVLLNDTISEKIHLHCGFVIDAEDLATSLKFLTTRAKAGPQNSSVSQPRPVRKVRFLGESVSHKLDYEEDQSEEEAAVDDDADAADDTAFARARQVLGRKSAQRPGSKLLQSTDPRRYIAVSSLVDGEFGDFSTIRQAFMHKQQRELTSDLELFLQNNGLIIEHLCHRFYSNFLRAGSQCSAVKDGDVGELHTVIASAARDVQGAGNEMKGLGAAVLQGRTVCQNLSEMQRVLRVGLAPAKILAAAESQMQRGQLIGAITSLSQLESSVAPLADCAIGTFVLEARIPKLRAEIRASAVQLTNRFAKQIRMHAAPIGEAALEQMRLVSRPAAPRTVEMPGDGTWRIREGDEKAVDLAWADEAVAKGFGRVAAELCEIATAPSVQDLFNALGEQEHFVAYVRDSREKQLQLEVSHAEQVNSLESFQRFCHGALGFIVVDSILLHTTSPRVMSEIEIHHSWDKLTQCVAQRAVVTTQGDDSDGKKAKAVLAVCRQFMEATEVSIRGTHFNMRNLTAVTDELRGRLHSSFLQVAASEVTQCCITDTFSPVAVVTAEEYAANVTQCGLHVAPSLVAVPPFRQDDANARQRVYLPFSSFVPAVGRCLLRLVRDCFGVAECCGGGDLNNTDQMIREYLTVALRTCGELLNMRLQEQEHRSVFPFAVLAASINAFLVVVSVLEQEYAVLSRCDVGVSNRVGHPRMFEGIAKLFNSVRDSATEKCNAALGQHLTEIFSPGAVASYWRNLDGKMESDILFAAGSYMESLLSQLLVVWSPPVVHSVAASCVHTITELLSGCMESSIRGAQTKDMNLLRAAVKQFEKFVTAALPQIDSGLNRVFAASAELPALRVPFETEAVCAEWGRWINAREVQLAEEAARQLEILASLEAAGKGVMQGLNEVGSTVVGGVKDAGHLLVDTVKDAGRATKKTFFGSRKKEKVAAPAPNGQASTASATAWPTLDIASRESHLPPPRPATPPPVNAAPKSDRVRVRDART